METSLKNIIVRLRDIEKIYGGKSVIDHLNLDVAQGEFLTLLGPSGCGKTTTLRMIGGFEDTDGGQIFLEDQDVAGKAPNHRDVNTVFQSYALFPHMNVFDNVAFGLVEKKVPKAEVKKRVDEMIELVQLQGMEKRMPSQMSGGQKQRVAIARALVNRPKVLLLDEPLGALDLKLRKQMQFELKELQKKLKITFIYVTHDQEEALTMSDRIAVMNEGRIEQLGTPVEIYNHPKTKFVADFIGESNIFEAYIEEKKGNRISLVMESGKVELDAPDFEYDEMVYVCVRPENMKASMEPRDGFTMRGTVMEHIFVGSTIKTIIELPSSQLVKMTNPPEDEVIPVGTNVYLYWLPKKAVVMHTREDRVYEIIEGAGNEKEEQ